MNLRIRQLIRYFLSPETRPKQNNRGLVFLFAFLIAFGLWMIVTLNETYETTLRYAVKLPENVKIGPDGTPTIRIEAEGSGINLMLARLRSRKDTLAFDFSEEELREGYLVLQGHEDQLKNSIKGVNIVELRPEKLYFDYLSDFSNKVPLVFSTDLTLAPAYQLEEEPMLDLDSVLLRGPKEIIDTIKFWKTSGKVEQEIREPSSFEVSVLDTLEGIDVYPKTVNVSVKPTKYTEIKLRISLEITELPADLEVRLSHAYVDYTCLVPMDEYSRVERLSQGFKIKVPFGELNEEVPSFIPKANLPDWLRLIRQSPMEVSFVIIYPENFSP